jgi:pyridoxal 5'-phosphate synthase pdxT subunit
LQGAVARHTVAFENLGVATSEVRTADDLDDVDALVMPGGESTTMSLLLDANELRDPLARRLAGGMPALGTCAGMILLATNVLDGRADQHSFGSLDIDVRRNAFGRQIESFEADLVVRDLEDGALHAVFIRAPRVERTGPGVEVLAELDGKVVMVRQDAVMAAAFHPELSDDRRVHELFLSIVR